MTNFIHDSSYFCSDSNYLSNTMLTWSTLHNILPYNYFYSIICYNTLSVVFLCRTILILCILYSHLKYSYTFFFLWRYSPNLGLGLPPWNSSFHFGFIDLRQSVGLLGRVISSSQGLSTCTQTLNIHALSVIRTHDPGFRACLRPLGYRDRHIHTLLWSISHYHFQ
jgi:hypothetical protein